MLAIYDKTHGNKSPLTNYSNYHIERAKGQLDLLYFDINISAPEYASLQREGYIGTETYNEYVIKEINLSDSDKTTANVVCDLNVEDIKGHRVDSFESVEQSATDTTNAALNGTGWVVGTSDVTRLRTVKKTQVMAWDVLLAIQSAFNCEMEFVTSTKKVNIYQQRGQDKGVYFAEQLNLKTLSSQGSSRDYITCLIPVGKDNLSIADVNGGQDYIVNHQYSNKNIYGWWVDNRYTVAQDLKDDATERLDYLSKPVIAYTAEVADLAKNSPDKYAILDYDYGDVITLLASSKNVKEKQRVVKIDIYPDEPEKNTCELANRIASLDTLDVRFLGTSDTVDQITTQDGQIDGSKVDVPPDENLGTVTVQSLNAIIATIGTIMATKVSATTIDAINGLINNLQSTKADIRELEANYATIETLQSVNATLTNLVAGKATIEDLQAANAAIDSLQSTYADLTTVVAGKATIDSLNAAQASIDGLVTNVGTIVALLSDNATIDTLKSQEVMANFATLVHGTIGDAQIDKLTAAVIQGGELDTALVTILGSDGRFKIADNTLQVFDGVDAQHLFERLSFGKIPVLDANGNPTADYTYGFRIRGADGTTILYDENGQTKEGFTDGYNKVVQNAPGSLDPAALNIEKVVTKINDAQAQINGSKIFMDDQTLRAGLTEYLKTQDRKITSVNMQIAANTHDISLKVSQSEYDDLIGDYDPAVDGTLSNKFTDIEQSTDQVNTTISKYTGGGTNLLLNSSALSDLAYWPRHTGTILYDTDLSGALASRHCFELASPDGSVEGMIGQDVSVVIGKPYVLSFRYKKQNANRAYAQIKDGTRVVTIWQDSVTASSKWVNYPDSQDSNSVVVVFTPLNSTTATISFGTVGTGFLVGDIMFAQNDFPQAWSPNSLEFYRENIVQDVNGITISSVNNSWLANYQNDSITMYQKDQTPVVDIGPDVAKLPSAIISGDVQIGKLKFIAGTNRIDIAILN